MKRLCGLAVLAALTSACGSDSSDGDKKSNNQGGGGSKSGSAGTGGDTAKAGNSSAGTKSEGGTGAGPSNQGGASGGKPGDMPEKPTPDPCIASGECPAGVWTDVTPTEVELNDALSCGNFGTYTVAVDPLKPSDFYAAINCQGVWKSTDYGLNWTGPINTGKNGMAVMDTAGGLAMPHTAQAGPPTIFSVGIRGGGNGFWKSTNGGVDWTQYNIGPATSDRQDFYPPEVDPYDADHLLMVGHEQNIVVESKDGGETWTKVTLDAGMDQQGGTGQIFFVDMGDPGATATTWLWLAQWTGGNIGTWRTEDAGGTWTHVDKNEHAHSTTQMYQPDSSGVVYLPGAYSDSGWGVIRSEDYGKTWAHVGMNATETVVFGTEKNVYAMYGWAVGAGNPVDANIQAGAQPGTGDWMKIEGKMLQGPGRAAVSSDGTHAIVVAACYNAGLWRYIEP